METNVFSDKPKQLILYHGSDKPNLIPRFGFGKKANDYGRGFYTTPDYDLACEWAAGFAKDNATKAYVNKYVLDCTDLFTLDFEDMNALPWIAELMYNRKANVLFRLEDMYNQFVERYKFDTSPYDIIKGWRADSSYFQIVRYFISDNLDVALLPEVLKIGGFGTQILLQSEKSFKQIRLVDCKEISIDSYLEKFRKRDVKARDDMIQMIKGSKNKSGYMFSDFIEEGKI